MKRLLITFFALLGLTLASSAHAAFSNGYTYRRAITIDHTLISSSTPITNFPALISITTSTLETTSTGGNVQNVNGYDIIFTSDLAGNTTSSFEMERYTSSTGELEAWVKVPTLSTSTDTTLYMFYGNSSINSFQGSSTAVWDTNYKDIWHLGDNAGNTTVTDSTGNANGTNAANTSGKTVTGQVDGALSYNGSSDYTSYATNLSGTPILEVDYWMKWTSFATNDDKLAMEYSTNLNSVNGGFIVDMDSSAGGCTQPGGIDFLVKSDGGYSGGTITRPSAGAWHHYTIIMDISQNPDAASAYVDGQAVTVTRGSCTVNNSGNFGNFTLYGMSRAGSSLFGAGTMDEFRLSTTARSADWIKTEYNNQNSPSTFETLGAEQTNAAAGNSLVRLTIGMLKVLGIRLRIF